MHIVSNLKIFSQIKWGILRKIVLKVSDFRSSVIQGKFLAKKGLWVSEYRIESGLNCGGHAFATDGFLLGPILEEFKLKKESLFNSLYNTVNDALDALNSVIFNQEPEAFVTVQGGIGTHSEDKFLRNFYDIKSTGWATPFLTVPEATVLDDETRQLLINSSEDDTYIVAFLH